MVHNSWLNFSTQLKILFDLVADKYGLNISRSSMTSGRADCPPPPNSLNIKSMTTNEVHSMSW